jgi:hypothetical protein
MYLTIIIILENNKINVHTMPSRRHTTRKPIK